MPRFLFYMTLPYPIRCLIYGLVVLTCWQCSTEAPVETLTVTYQRSEGETMGTYYRITYRDSLQLDLQAAFDSILWEVNQETSTYIDTSLISRFNRAATGVSLAMYEGREAAHFIRSFEVARRVYTWSEGAFDPTVMPLVNYWGFGYTPRERVAEVDSSKIAELTALVDFSRVALREGVPGQVTKPVAAMQLDFSACAKGHGVDALASYLESVGITDYLVDIGGESRARGHNPEGRVWQIGINLPLEQAGLRDVSFILPLANRAIATSGNYRNYYKVGEQTYSHTINPRTGFPERSDLLSTSILAPDCATADGLATACMVLGADRALALIERLPDTEAYLLVSTPDGGQAERFTTGFRTIYEAANQKN